MNRILIIDGMALLFRGYYATAHRRNFMETTDHIPTNGIFQFLRYFLDATQKFSPTHILCCWDLGKDSFRTELYKDYKANRSDPPKQLIPQFDLCKEVVSAFNLPNVGLKSFEADDCIATLVNTYKVKDEVIVLTGDRDLLQLVDKHVKVAIMLKGQGNYEIYHKENFYHKMGIHPSQVVDMKALMGDQADNYPGVRGIGEVTALKLIKKFDSIQGVLQSLDQLSPSLKDRVINHQNMLHLSYNLAKLKKDLPLHVPLDKARWCYNKAEIKEKFIQLNIDHLVSILPEHNVRQS